MIKGLADELIRIIKKIKGAPLIDEKTLREVIRDIQRALLKADVSVDLVLKITENIKARVLTAEVPPGFTKRDVLLKVVYDELVSLLGGEKIPQITIPRGTSYTIMLVGLQGSGKTTSAAKLAWFYKNRGYKTALVCADTYRPAAYIQLKQLVEKYDIPVWFEKDKSAVQIAYDGVKHFKSEKYNIIIIDTAGRHKEEEGLLKEMEVMFKKIRPDEVMFVIDATIGKQAGKQAAAFQKRVPISSIFLTKLDGSAKGGGALAAIVATGAIIKFIGTGEKIEEIEVFNPPRFINRLLGLGDLEALIERFKKHEELMKLQERILKTGKLTLYDMKIQLKSLRKMGSLGKLLSLIPGGTQLPLAAAEVNDEKIKKWIAILDSMTLEELLNPSIINSSRIRRISRGAGVSPRDVKDLLKSYEVAKRYIKQLSRKRAHLMKLSRLW
ncbi:MAG: signal recognition particle protein [Thermoprotei archaeon]|nr:MAG: signal recognition particle protein [Thermoprotei archaeon]